MSAKHTEGGLRRWWAVLKRPSGKHSLGVLLVVGFIFGILCWGGYNWAIELSNTETFCISRHEMEVNVYEEYRDTIHYNNRTGVRMTCPDCHVPKEWHHKFIRKIVATGAPWNARTRANAGIAMTMNRWTTWPRDARLSIVM